MKNSEKILEYLSLKEGQFCDDCLSMILKIEPRQAVNIICRQLNQQEDIVRTRGNCSWCSKNKLVNTRKQSIEREKSPQNEIFIEDIINISTPENINRLPHDILEKRVAKFLERKFEDVFIEKALMVGENKKHRFDLVSQDDRIVVECKSYTWTKDGNFPSAKISTALEAAFYLSRIKADRKIIIFEDSINNKGESLIQTFVRRYDGMLDDIEIWSFIADANPEKDSVIISRAAKDIWYKKIYNI